MQLITNNIVKLAVISALATPYKRRQPVAVQHTRV